MKLSYKSNVHLPTLWSGSYKRNKNICLQKFLYMDIQSSFIHNSSKLDAAQTSINLRMDKQWTTKFMQQKGWSSKTCWVPTQKSTYCVISFIRSYGIGRTNLLWNKPEQWMLNLIFSPITFPLIFYLWNLSPEFSPLPQSSSLVNSTPGTEHKSPRLEVWRTPINWCSASHPHSLEEARQV